MVSSVRRIGILAACFVVLFGTGAALSSEALGGLGTGVASAECKEEIEALRRQQAALNDAADQHEAQQKADEGHAKLVEQTAIKEGEAFKITEAELAARLEEARQARVSAKEQEAAAEKLRQEAADLGGQIQKLKPCPGIVLLYEKNGVQVAMGTREPEFAWGNLQFTSEVTAPVECRVAAGGFVEDSEGEVGRGAIETFSTYDCASTSCLAPDFETVTAENFGEANDGTTVSPRVRWPTELDGKEGIRVGTRGMQLFISCREPEGAPTEASIPCFSIEKAEAERIATFPAELTPGVKNRKKIGIEPSELVFDAGSGQLNCAELFPMAIHKSLKFEGYENEELITTKSQ
jgi:hypothetical protein